MVKIFVYGILMNGSTPAILKNYERFYRGHASIRKNKGKFIVGELQEINDTTLAKFDSIEGVEYNYYHRFMTEVHTEDGEKHKCWVYQQVVDKDEN